MLDRMGSRREGKGSHLFPSLVNGNSKINEINNNPMPY
jgi:hypothetical protein